MALVTDPPLVLMDEPTSALDVLTQANIMNTLKDIKWESHRSFVFISHDVGACSAGWLIKLPLCTEGNW